MMSKLPLVSLCAGEKTEEFEMGIDDAIDYVIEQLAYLPEERFASIQCRNGKAMSYSVLHIGSCRSVSMIDDLDDLARLLLLSEADEVVFLHTHPDSGAYPSAPDLANFHTLNVFLSLLNIRVSDILVTADFGEGTNIEKYSIRENLPDFFEIPEKKEELLLYDPQLEQKRQEAISKLPVL